MVNSQDKGYRFENYLRLLFLFNGFHSKRNFKSRGQEDLMFISPTGIPHVCQAKDTKAGENSLTPSEIKLFVLHAKQNNMVPVYAYKYKRKVFIINLKTGKDMGLARYTKEWQKNRMSLYKEYNELKKKAKSPKQRDLLAKYIIANFEKYKDVICM